MDRHQPSTRQDAEQSKIERRRPDKILAGGVALSLTVAALAGCAPLAEEPHETPSHSQETSSPTPEAPWSPEVTVEQLEIPAGLKAEETGKLIIERFDAWKNAGTDNERLHQDLYNFNGKTGDFVTSITDQYAPLYSDAIYIDDWRSHQDLTDSYNFQTKANAYILELNLITSNPENGDLEAFHRNIWCNEVREISNDGTTRVIEVDYTESNNASRNRVGEAFQSEEEGNFGTPKGTYTFTLVTVDGVEKISAIAVVGR